MRSGKLGGDMGYGGSVIFLRVRSFLIVDGTSTLPVGVDAGLYE